MDVGNFVNFLDVFIMVISAGFQGSYVFIENCSRMSFSHGGICNRKTSLL